jgi:hypothetical protein
MSRHAGTFTAAALACAICLAGGASFSAMAAGGGAPPVAPPAPQSGVGESLRFE